MNLTIRQLRYICEASREGSIQAASRKLAISQSSIVAALEAAEFEVGAKLFDRRPAVGIKPTPAGQRFIRLAHSLLAAEDEFKRGMKETTTSMPRHIRVGCFEPFGATFMPRVMRRYLDQVSDAEISLMEGDHTQLAAWIEKGEVDFAVAYDIGPDLGQSAAPICKLPAHVLMSAEDRLANREAVSLAEIVDRPFILLDLPHTGAYLLALFEMNALRPRISLRTRSYETVRCAVAAGFGVAILNMRPLSPGLGEIPGLVRLPLSDELPAPTLQVIDIYGPHKPFFVRSFIDVIRAFFAEMGPARFAVATPQRQHGLILF